MRCRWATAFVLCGLFARTLPSDEPAPSRPPRGAFDNIGKRSVKTAERSVPKRDGLGRYRLTWAHLATTAFDQRNYPVFSETLRPVDGGSVILEGHMAPLDEFGALTSFLFFEKPAGCLECQTVDPTALIHVELEPGTRERIYRGPITIQGKLRLNADDPEDFLYLLSEATILSRH